MPPNQQNPYDFILSSNHQPKPGFNIGGGWKGRGVIAGLALLVIIILYVIVSFFLGSAAKAQNEKLADILKAQNEIIRVSAMGSEKAKLTNTRTFSVTTQLAVTSEQQQLRTILNKRGLKEKEINKLLAGSKNAKTDAALDEATKNNRFDETFNTLMLKQLSDYQKLLKSATSSSTSKNEKKLLESATASADRLSKPTVTPATTATDDDTSDSDEDSEALCRSRS